jgi:hypothetical protein
MRLAITNSRSTALLLLLVFSRHFAVARYCKLRLQLLSSSQCTSFARSKKSLVIRYIVISIASASTAPTSLSKEQLFLIAWKHNILLRPDKYGHRRRNQHSCRLRAVHGDSHPYNSESPDRHPIPLRPQPPMAPPLSPSSNPQLQSRSFSISATTQILLTPNRTAPNHTATLFKADSYVQSGLIQSGLGR